MVLLIAFVVVAIAVAAVAADVSRNEKPHF